jgi:FHS family glucose/mannose:H+ symporter-like MFS transporter
MSRFSGHKTAGEAVTVALLFAGFLYTGAMMVLLGLMLPRIEVLHGLSDSQAGALLATQAVCSATGALFVRHQFGRTLTAGYLLMAAGSAALLIVPAWLDILAIGAFGLGLGMAMTSTSIVVGRLFPDARGSALSLLNLSWSAGAAVCPLVVARIPGHFSAAAVCIPIAACAALFALLIGPRTLRSVPSVLPQESAVTGLSWTALLLFSALGFLYVGAESTLGGWMSTYATRDVLWNFQKSNLAAGCFWGAMLVGRAATPLFLRSVSERRLHWVAIVAAFLGTVVLVVARTPAALVTGASWTGFALAPIYPLTIALFLEQAGESRNTGWVFAAAGYGGALFPGLTGLVSTDMHSLSKGLLIPLAAVTALLPLALWLPKVPGARPTRMAAQP